MRMVKPVRVLWTLGLAAVILLPLARVASANPDDVSIERSGSIIIFPKVVWDGTRDTIIQIANTSNNMLHAHCFYVNAAPANPSFPPGPTNPAQCLETDFDVWLTRQQPTHWVASEGRSMSMDGSSGGFVPGLIPPVQQGFIGELKCVQVDASDVPLRANALKGEATIRSLSGDVSEYNAIAFQGNPDMTISDPLASDPNDLVLDLTMNNGGEYSACPDTLLLNHFAQGATDPVINQLGDCTDLCTAGPTPGADCTADTDCGTGGICGGSCPAPLSTELTLVPCSQNLENQIFGTVTIQFVVYNEFEQPFSTSTTVSCYLNLPLDEIGAPGNNPFTYTVLGTLGAYSRINPNPGNGGLIGVAEEFRSATGGAGSPTAAAIFNLHTEGNRFDAATDGKGNSVQGATDHIIIPQP
jgi:hypothetical protein